MGAYVRGTAITLVQKFYKVDPITEVASLADPDVVVFTIEGPAGTKLVYAFGADPEVKRPLGHPVGVFICEIGAPLPVGGYTYVCVGTGTVEATGSGSFSVVERGVSPSAPSGVVEYGPCSPWISGDDVLQACGASGLTEDQAFKLESAAVVASSVMWEISGRQFSGVCERTVRPCRKTCGCFGQSVAVGLGPYEWTGWGGTLGYGGGLAGEWWTNECGDRCGCGSEELVRLAGYPVREILEVKIGGTVVDPANYGLVGHRDVQARGIAFPACQQLDLADTEPGTFSIRYTGGVEAPELGKQAAAQLGCEVWKALNGEKCGLPTKATRVVRQGITVERTPTLAQALREGASGMTLVDLFVGSVNPTGMRRPPAVFSPDLQQFPREQ